VANKFRDNAGILAEWQTASGIAWPEREKVTEPVPAT
jgi:hypothetical protein